jgi:hypothetical protein
MKRILQEVAFYFAVAIVAMVTVEIGYRINVLLKDPRLELRPEKITELSPITAYTRSLWRFDADEGFRYTDRTGIFQTEIRDGRIGGCGPIPPINKDGSPGISEGNYKDADFKIAVFGDSFSVFVDDSNTTWVNRLQTRLQKELGRSVHILNFARDGSGLLQALDVAAAELPKWNPDLAVIAFNTNQMMAKRTWRVEKLIAGEARVLTTFNRTENPNLNDPNTVYDTAILDSDIDIDWCEKNKNGGDLDQVGRDIVGKYMRFRTPRYSAFTLSRSFFWNRVIHTDPFYAGFSQYLTTDEVANDSKVVEAVTSIKKSGVPLLLVHLPESIEIAAGEEFSDKKAEQIAKEISRITGKPVHGLVNRISPIDRPDRMNSSPSDMHPSTFGMDLYAEAVSKAVVANIFLSHQK